MPCRPMFQPRRRINFPASSIPTMMSPDEAAIGDAELTEDSAAERFVRRYGRDFRYDHETGFWYYWTGSRWKRTKTGRCFISPSPFARTAAR